MLSSLYQIVSTAQTILPESDDAIQGHVQEIGLTFQILPTVPGLIYDNIRSTLVEMFDSVGGIQDWNDIFWVVHPGGRAILDRMEDKMGLREHKLKASRHVLSEYGNMSSASVVFVMDEMRRDSLTENRATTGEGLEWGVLLAFGPGLTIETILLRSIPVQSA